MNKKENYESLRTGAWGTDGCRDICYNCIKVICVKYLSEIRKCGDKSF